MPLLQRAAVAAAAFALAGALLAARASACSVCQAGDPLYSAAGASAQPAGSVSAYLELQGWRKTSGLLQEAAGEPPEPGREVNESQQLSLYLSWSPIDRLTLTLGLPYRFNAISEEPAGEPHLRSTLSGFGDASLMGSVVLWRNRDVLPSTWLEGRLLAKFPTGNRQQEVNGAVDPHLQLGTGSWDFGFGLAGAHRLESASLYASFLYRVNEPGALRYRYGDVTLANLGVEAPLGHWLGDSRLDALTPGLELNFRYSGFDQFQGERYRDSGGAVLYATPSLRLRLPGLAEWGAPFLRLAVQLPLGQAWLHGQQHEGVVWSTGLGVTF